MDPKALLVNANIRVQNLRYCFFQDLYVILAILKKKEFNCSIFRHRAREMEEVYPDTAPRNFGSSEVLFTTVREPVDRFISGFLDKCAKGLVR